MLVIRSGPLSVPMGLKCTPSIMGTLSPERLSQCQKEREGEGRTLLLTIFGF